MTLILCVHNNQLILSVFELCQLTENLVTLDIDGWEVYSVFNVPIFVILLCSQVE